MSNENSNLRVGSAGAGLFVGSSQIMAGGVANLLKEITIAPDFNASNTTSVLVANLSSKELLNVLKLNMIVSVLKIILQCML